MPQFAEFLELIALSNGNEMSYQSLSNDCGASPNTIKNYIEILEDTLLVFKLTAFTKTKKRKAITRAKLYFFDLGVTNSLANRREILPESSAFGTSLEHFIILEVRAYLSYSRSNLKMHYWRSTSQFEVDLIIGNKWALEIKSSKAIHDGQLKGIRALKEEGVIEKFGVVCRERQNRLTSDGIHIFPWSEFLSKLWNGEIV